MTSLRMRSPGRSRIFALIAATPLPAAGITAAQAQDWTTEAEFEIGGRPDGGTSLWQVSQVRVNPDGSRVYVTERQGYGDQVDRGRRVTVWSPDGSLLVEIGPEGETRGFGIPLGVRPARTGFWVRYPSRITLHSDGGSLVETIEHPRAEVNGVSVTALAVLEDRALIGVTRGRPDVRLGWSGGKPDLDEHLLLMTPAEDGGSWDTIADLDRRNHLFGIRARSSANPIPTDHFAGQPFSDTDLFYLNAISGSVGVVTRNGAPGEVAIHEITIRGDTTWRRRLDLPSVPTGRGTRRGGRGFGRGHHVEFGAR